MLLFLQNGHGYVDSKAKMDKIIAAVEEALKAWKLNKLWYSLDKEVSSLIAWLNETDASINYNQLIIGFENVCYCSLSSQLLRNMPFHKFF